MSRLAQQIERAARWFADRRFDGITRLYTPRDVAEQQGTIPVEYPVVRRVASEFFDRLRELFGAGESITTFGPYSPGQAVTMKRLGIEGIYLGGWATSAKGSVTEDPGADLASYPLSQVPNEAAPIVRALLAADRNQHFARARMTAEEREQTPIVDFRPFLIADADAGHGGDGHVRNLIRRFVEAGVTGYHIEDQKPGVKKCGHQGGKVLVTADEQIKRLNAARFQLDVMRVPGIIVARTDAEAATFIESSSDERDQPFLLGATNVNLPSYRAGYIALLRQLHGAGVEAALGYRLFAMSEGEYALADAWLERTGISALVEERAGGYAPDQPGGFDALLDPIATRYVDQWQTEAGLKTYARAVADVMEFRVSEGEEFEMSVDEWLDFAGGVSLYAARERARILGIRVIWSPGFSRTPEGYYPVKNGIDFAVSKSLAVAPFADVLWMETKTANLDDARRFAEAIHARYPEKLLAYNLSPSFNWDTTGMSDDAMRKFPAELARLGYVFNFITYGGHQIDGLAAEEFTTALREDGMLALARLQRRFRLLESPYRTPQTLVGGKRLDGALMASSGRTASTRAMGKGSTQFQHLVQTEAPRQLLEGWLEQWRGFYGFDNRMHVSLRPCTGQAGLLELCVRNGGEEPVANMVFTSISDRLGETFLSVRDQNTYVEKYRKKRLMTLVILFLIHRYHASAVHFVSPTDDNQHQARKMKNHGLFSEVHSEIGQIIVATVNAARVAELIDPEADALDHLIDKTNPQSIP